MKTLIVVRHAKSSWDEPGISDFNRPLSERGERDAPRMAKRLKEKDLAISTVLSSPAVRALETCKVFVKVLGLGEEQIQMEKGLYHAGDEMILNVVKGINDNSDIAMIFGHNPGLTEFVNNLTEADIENIPTTGIVCCNLEVEKWGDMTWGCGNRDFFDWPKRKQD